MNISTLHPVAQVFAVIGIATFACIAIYNVIKLVREI